MKGEEANPPAKSWTNKFTIWSVFSLIILLAIVVALVVWFVRASPAKLLGYVITFTVLVTLGILVNRFKTVESLLAKVVGTYFLFLALMIITLVPFYLFGLLSRLILYQLTFGFQLAILVVWGLLLASALLLIATERNRERLFNRLQKLGHFGPVAYSLDLLMSAVMFFSPTTYLLVKYEALKFNGSAESNASHDAIAGLYIWHFLEAVPLLKVNETLHWKEPLTYDSGWVGAVLLLFKIAVIVPVISAFAWYWKQVGGQAEKK